jgi:phenylacetate-CoA ligase
VTANDGPQIVLSIPRALKSIEALKAGAPAILTAYARNESIDPRALRALQDERLRRLVHHASERVPFWKRRFARYGIRPTEVRSIADLNALPPLDDRELADFGEDLVAEGSSPGFEVRSLARPTRKIAIDPTARRERVADELRHVRWTGLDWRAPRAALVARSERGEPLEGNGGKMRGALRSGVWLHATTIDEDALRRFATDAGRARAEVLSGPPSALERVADAIETGTAKNGVAPFRPRAIQSWGECLGDERRERLEAALGAQVYDVYRTHEFGELAHECGERRGLHVTMERAILEFVRDDRRVEDGIDGEILVTPLDNLAMPLFRYRVGDVGVRAPQDDRCGCGRTSERILLTDGRVETLVSSPAGMRVHREWFEWMIEQVPGILDWQVTQDEPANLQLLVVPGAAWRDDSETWMKQTIRDLDPRFIVSVATATALPAREDGRRERVRSTVPLSWNGSQA